MSGEGHRTRSKDGRAPVDAGVQPGGKIGRYVVVSRLGEGAMGMVYLAYDPKLDRQLALKVLRRRSRSSRSAQERQQRLRREAQAMAQLNHAHVVTVHDVGVADGRVFLAMDYVLGQDLREWLEARRHPWRRVLRTFIYAGRGLAAAHDAGVIHRDFKPENVLVGEEGTVKVMDFGLARPGGEGLSRTSGTSRADDERAPTAAASVVDAPIDDGEEDRDWWRHESNLIDVKGGVHLTRSGDVLGTPSYLAPELFEGGEANAQTDQFAFCVALYEGLYGVRPFAGESMAALAFNMNRERITPPPRGSKVPVWLGRLVRRGLSLRPDRRYPSMEALIDALIQGAARRRIRRAGAVAVGLVLAGGALSYALVPEPEPCRGGEARLRTVWNGDRASMVADAFTATGVGYADEALRRAEQRIETYAETWVGVYTSVCEATAVRKDQSPELLDRRIACLDERLAELDALLQVFSEADPRVVERAAQAVSELRGPGICGEALADLAEPDDPALSQQLEVLRGRLHRAEALEHAGRYDDAAELALEVSAEAELLGQTRVHGEALLQAGAAKDRGGEYDSALENLRKAYFVANEQGYDLMAARAAVALISVEGIHLAHGEEGLSWARHAEAAFERSDPESVLRGQYHAAMGKLYLMRFEVGPAREHYEKAIAIEREALGEEHERVATLLAYLGAVQEQSGRSEDAIESFETAIKIARNALGPEHPDLSVLHNNYAVVLYGRQDLKGAQTQLERALAIQREALGEHPLTATAIDNLGVMLVTQGEYAKGKVLFEEALAMREKVLLPDHPSVANSLANLASVLQHDRDLDGARRLYERARDILEKTDGPDNPQVAQNLFNLGQLALYAGQIEPGHDQCTRALQMLEPLRSKDHPDRMGPLSCVGWAKLEKGEAQEALELLEQAYPMSAGEPEMSALVRLLMVWALHEIGGDAERIETLRGEARERYEAETVPPPERLARWLNDSP